MSSTSPYRDPARPGGWVPWAQRLAPVMDNPGVWVDFPTSTVTMATSTAYKLRKGLIPVPGEAKRWRFRASLGRVQACYLQR